MKDSTFLVGVYGVTVPGDLLGEDDLELLGVQLEMQTNFGDFPLDLSDAMLERVQMTQELYDVATVEEVRLAVDDAVSALKLEVNRKLSSPFERIGHMHLCIIPDEGVFLGVGILILHLLVNEEDNDKLLNAVLELQQAGAGYWTCVT